MKCDSKMMLKTAAGLGIALAVAYFTLPAAQTFILASAPILLALICPVAMLLMMGNMNGNKKDDDGAKPDKTTPSPGPLGAGRDEA
jgi:hypothetical protein